jgi:nucleotide-binding universal stress UspA family protein
MKILVPSTGPAPDRLTVGYVVNISKKLNAQLVLLRILSENETHQMGEQHLRRFVEAAQSADVPVKPIIKRGIIADAIIEVASENAVNLIIQGISHGEIIAEWMNARGMEKTDIPVLVIPKWVPAPVKPAPNI